MSNVNQRQTKVIKRTTTLSKSVDAKPANFEKIAKPPKEKIPKKEMVHDRFTMTKDEYAKLSALKERLIKLGQTAKKSELIRAGILQLTAMTDATLKSVINKVPMIKTCKSKA
jgi:hypothetical protein